MPKTPCMICGGTGRVPDKSRPVKNGTYITYPYSRMCDHCRGTGFQETPDLFPKKKASSGTQTKAELGGCFPIVILMIVVLIYLII